MWHVLELFSNRTEKIEMCHTTLNRPCKTIPGGKPGT